MAGIVLVAGAGAGPTDINNLSTMIHSTHVVTHAYKRDMRVHGM